MAIPSIQRNSVPGSSAWGQSLCHLLWVVLCVLFIDAPVTAQAQNLCVGNLVYLDANSNGVYDFNEGVGNVRVEIWRLTGDPENPEVLANAYTTQSSGFYLFVGLANGTYYVKIPGTEFAAGKPLHGTASLPGAQLIGDDNEGEDGLDSFDLELSGASSIEFIVAPGFGPVGSEEPGFAGTIDDSDDINGDMTIDFGFYRPVGLGNLVFADMNGNGRADAGEGVPGVAVQLFTSTAQIGVDAPVADVITDSSGHYQFGGLQAGSYKVHIPGSEFAAGGPLEQALSMTGTGLPEDDDDANAPGHLGDNGVDEATPDLQGVTSGTVTLAPGTEPTGTSESGAGGASDDLVDADNDLTVDFGFVFPPDALGVGNVVFEDFNNNGRYDDGEGIFGMRVQLIEEATGAVAGERTTRLDGSYFFGSVPAGDYHLHVPASEFAPGKPLFSALSVEQTASGDDHLGEEGVDVPFPESTGINSVAFTLQASSLITDAEAEQGHNAASDNFRDERVDLTHDLGFTIRAREPLSLGNLVFFDTDGNGRLNDAEAGIAGVTVKLFRQGDNPLSAQAVATLQTASNGTYRFTGLVPGSYFVHVPAAEFAAGRPLLNMRSSPGHATDDNADDPVSENGVDAATPSVSGISSVVVELTDNGEPVEIGFEADMDAEDDNNGDMTVDLGFTSDCPTLSISPLTLIDAAVAAVHSQTLTLVGDSGPVVWSLASGVLPDGITLSTAGVLSGTATQSGTFTFTARATTVSLCTASQSYTLTVLPAMNLGVGNLVFLDSNGNGHADVGEGVPQIEVKLYAEGAVVGSTPALQSTTTDTSGRYLFQSLIAGRYFVHVSAGNFGVGAPLHEKVSMTGAGTDKPKDDDVDENGVDSLNAPSTGISSGVFELAAGTEPTDAGGESGLDAAADNAADSNVNMTIDFGFVPSPAVSVGLGNLVFRDDNSNGVIDDGEGRDGVVVQLFQADDDVVLVPPLRSTVTAGGGRYSFLGLAEGSYKVYVPASEFAQGRPLYGCLSVTGAGADAAADDDVDENGVDAVNPLATGVASGAVALALGTEPITNNGETGADKTLDDAADTNADFTVDLGFVRNCGTIIVSPASLNPAPTGVVFSTQFTASGGMAPYVFTFAFGELPPGLELATNGTLAGTPTTSGIYEFAVQATDDLGCFTIHPCSLEVAAPPLGVGNVVFFDKNGNGHADAGEGVDGVTVELHLGPDTPGPGSLVATTSTSGGGRYLFDDLDAGDYRLHLPASMFAQGAPLWKMLSVPGELAGSDDESGEDGQDALDPAVSGISTAVFTLQAGLCPLDAVELGQGGSSDAGRDGDVDLTRDFGLVDQTALPSTYSSWAVEHGLDGSNNAAHDNPDGDADSNLLEYALGSSPASGGASDAFKVVGNQLTGQMEVQLRRRHGGLADLIYTVQVLADLGQSPGGWSATQIVPTVSNNGDGTETLTYSALELDPALSANGFGFVRVKVDLDANQDTTPEASAATAVFGWQHRTLELRNQTYAVCLVPAAVFTGAVGSVNGSSVDLSGSAGTADVAALLTGSREYYLEVIAGDQEGHRWEINETASSGSTLVLLPAEARSTQSSAPTNLAGDTIALRAHWKMIELFPASDFHATTDPGTADSLIVWNAVSRSYSTYWLASTPQGQRWLRVGDATLSNQNNLVIGPCDGLFTKPRVGSVSATMVGQARSWQIACPLVVGTNLVGNPHPVAQSFSARGMTTANGFTGNTIATAADRVNVWAGDASSATSYTSYYLLKSGATERWLKAGDATLVDQSAAPVFGAGLAAFINSVTGKVDWMLPAPWTP
jgi:hypothetical protein